MLPTCLLPPPWKEGSTHGTRLADQNPSTVLLATHICRVKLIMSVTYASSEQDDFVKADKTVFCQQRHSFACQISFQGNVQGCAKASRMLMTSTRHTLELAFSLVRKLTRISQAHTVAPSRPQQFELCRPVHSDGKRSMFPL